MSSPPPHTAPIDGQSNTAMLYKDPTILCHIRPTQVIREHPLMTTMKDLAFRATFQC